MARLAVIAALTAGSLSLIGFGDAQAATVVGTNSLLLPSYADQIESWLVNDPQLGYDGSLTFTNIYEKAPGDTSADFHAAADGMGPTIVVLEAMFDGVPQIIGGFDPQSWDSSSAYHLTPNVDDRTGFIFNLTASDRRDQESADSLGQYQTFNGAATGPTFGGGFDLYVPDNLQDGRARSFSYCEDASSYCAASDDSNILGIPGSTYFSVNGLEAFTVSTVPVPAGMPLMLTAITGLGLLGWRRRAPRLAV